jgi:hypothetical protein
MGYALSSRRIISVRSIFRINPENGKSHRIGDDALMAFSIVDGLNHIRQIIRVKESEVRLCETRGSLELSAATQRAGKVPLISLLAIP